jgi:hypothetical protein
VRPICSVHLPHVRGQHYCAIVCFWKWLGRIGGFECHWRGVLALRGTLDDGRARLLESHRLISQYGALYSHEDVVMIIYSKI